MAKRRLLIGVCLLVIAGCGQQDKSAVDAGEPPPSWDLFVATIIDEYYARNPETAVAVGLHQYDGRMTDRSFPAMEEYASWLEGIIAAASAYDDLDGLESFEKDYLLNQMRARLFWLRSTDFPTKNPRNYSFSVTTYVDRDYAPLEQRLAAYTDYIAQVPAAVVATMRRNLEPPLPAPFVDIGHRVFSGFRDYLADTVPVVFASVDDDELMARFVAANDQAIAVIGEAAQWLDSLRATATDDFALGEERFIAMLRETQGVEITLEELKIAGERDLEKNLASLATACADFAPGETTEACVRQVQNSKPPEGPVAAASRQLPMLKQFLMENDIVSIPSDEEARVAKSPPHRRFNLAYISIPGPLETGLPSVYYIAPPDPAWSEEDQRAYVPGESSLLGVSVHEVWPGHFLQNLHSHRADNRVGRYFSVSTFSEGWAHYAEEMMLDAGFGGGSAEIRIGQLLNALKRNVRYLSAIGLHAEAMTVAESEALFRQKALLDYGNARQQALRGTYDPGYLNYTLGKLMIKKLRDDWTATRGGRKAWRRFHDEFLSFGEPPIPLVRRLMLGEDFAGDQRLLDIGSN